MAKPTPTVKLKIVPISPELLHNLEVQARLTKAASKRMGRAARDTAQSLAKLETMCAELGVKYIPDPEQE